MDLLNLVTNSHTNQHRRGKSVALRALRYTKTLSPRAAAHEGTEAINMLD